MAVNKVIFDNEVLIDLSGDTVTKSALAKGYTAHDCHGDVIEGTFEAGSGSDAGFPDTILAGTTPIWSYLGLVQSASDATSERALSGVPKFVAPKTGTYRFRVLGWTNSSDSSSKKAYIYMSRASNKVYDSSAVALPLSNSDSLVTYTDMELTEGEKIWFFGKTATGIVSGVVGAVGKIYAIEVGINWDNGTS